MRTATLLRCAALGAAVLLLAAAARYQAAPPAAAAPAVRLRLAGSPAMAPLMADVARRFQRYHPEIRVDIDSGGAEPVLDSLRSGRADLALASRPLAGIDGGLQGVPIARDGVALVVHRDNPLSGLDRVQLAAILGGKIDNWRQLGGADLALRLLQDAAAGPAELPAPYPGLPGAPAAARPGGAPAVAADPRAVAILPLAEAERAARAGAAIKLLAVDGVPATGANVRNARYPLSRPLLLVSRGAPAGAARTFTQFCATSQVSDLVLAHDFVPYLD